jgi:hypothetical protein
VHIIIPQRIIIILRLCSVRRLHKLLSLLYELLLSE